MPHRFRLGQLVRYVSAPFSARGVKGDFTIVRLLGFMVDSLPEQFMLRRNSRHDRDRMCFDEHRDCKNLLE